MKVIKKIWDGVYLLAPTIYRDTRGFFFEFYNKRVFKEITGLEVDFVQDNLAHSRYGVLRGMHFQRAPHAQAKLVSVIQGEIFDVIVDMRPGSPTFGHWFSVVLNDKNRLQLFIPKGFAHGYLSLSDDTYVFYKTDAFYHPQFDGGFRYNDPQIGIDWPPVSGEYILSEKDKHLPFFKDLKNE